MQKPEASIAIQVVPKAPNNEEAVRIIDAVIAHLKGSGLPTYVGPFETSVEGDYDTLMQLSLIHIFLLAGDPTVIGGHNYLRAGAVGLREEQIAPL